MPDTDHAGTLNDEEPLEDVDNTDDPSLVVPPPNLFSQALQLAASNSPLTPLPLQTFSTESTTFHLNRCPDLGPLTVDEAAIKFKIPDLRSEIADYICHMQDLQSSLFKIGQ